MLVDCGSKTRIKLDLIPFQLDSSPDLFAKKYCFFSSVSSSDNWSRERNAVQSSTKLNYNMYKDLEKNGKKPKEREKKVEIKRRKTFFRHQMFVG